MVVCGSQDGWLVIYDEHGTCVMGKDGYLPKTPNNPAAVRFMCRVF